MPKEEIPEEVLKEAIRRVANFRGLKSKAAKYIESLGGKVVWKEETCKDCKFWNREGPEQLYSHNDPEWYRNNFRSCMNPKTNCLPIKPPTYPTRTDIISHADGYLKFGKDYGCIHFKRRGEI